MISSTRKIIAIDMDEVIADALGEHLMRYNRDFGTAITVEQLRGRWLWDVVEPAHQRELEAYIRSEDFFEVLEVMPGAQEAIAHLSEQYDVFIATAAMEVPTSFNAKFRWLKKHFPTIRPAHIVFCGDKSILWADYLIDDNPRQLRLFRGEGVLFSSPANYGVTGWRRVESWPAAEELFLRGELRPR